MDPYSSDDLQNKSDYSNYDSESESFQREFVDSDDSQNQLPTEEILCTMCKETGKFEWLFHCKHCQDAYHPLCVCPKTYRGSRDERYNSWICPWCEKDDEEKEDGDEDSDEEEEEDDEEEDKNKDEAGREQEEDKNKEEQEEEEEEDEEEEEHKDKDDNKRARKKQKKNEEEGSKQEKKMNQIKKNNK